ncbi:MAG: hypothetical protein Q8S00_32490 [Deltaproteobacteria bacterium]|nr:hypothetical protein [Deltaproteobacteria bacterium]
MTESYYDSVWPENARTEGRYVLVRSHYTPLLFEWIAQTKGDLLGEPEKIWLFLLDDPTWFRRLTPESWHNLNSPQGGIPKNVWAGVKIDSPEDIQNIPELRRIRARRLFLECNLEENGSNEALSKELNAWRCKSCGMRGEEKQRDCPNIHLCDRDTLSPQIEWIVGKAAHTIATPLSIILWPERPND